MSPIAFRRAALVTTGVLAVLSSTVFTTTGHAAPPPTPVQHLIMNGVLYLGTSDAPDLMELGTMPGGKVSVDMAADGNPELVLDGSLFASIDIDLLGGSDQLSTAVPDDVTVRGGAGNDTLTGYTGSDVLDGGPGDDSVWPGAGDQTIGGAGDDVVGFGQTAVGVTAVDGGPGEDTAYVLGTNSADSIAAFAGEQPGRFDVVRNGATVAQELAGFETSHFFGANGNDWLRIDPGLTAVAAEFEGGSGDDILAGGNEADDLSGGDGKDRIDGGAGNDAVDGFLNDHEVRGGAGDDTFWQDYTDGLEPSDLSTVSIDGGPGHDRLDVIETAAPTTSRSTTAARPAR